MHEKGDGRMIDKWLDMLGLYDFLGVICPGIFAAGMALFLWYVNICVDEKLLCVWSNVDYYLWYVNGGVNCEILNSISNNSIYYNILKYFLYVFIVVAIYVLGSCVHELGHWCKIVANTVSDWLCLKSFKFSESIKRVLGEAEKLFLELDLSNSSLDERKIWFKLMKRGDFCRNNSEYYLAGELDGNIKNEDLEKISSAFYQHCKRVVLLNGCGASSKKKESIYGFCRNMSVIFGCAILFVLFCYFVLGINNIRVFSGVGYEFTFLIFFFVVFCSKSIRYKNMEVVDTIRTYRYLAENQKKVI